MFTLLYSVLLFLPTSGLQFQEQAVIRSAQMLDHFQVPSILTLQLPHCVIVPLPSDSLLRWQLVEVDLHGARMCDLVA